MKKVWKIVIGGITNKIFNLVVVTVILILAAYTAVILHQSRNLIRLIDATNDRQQTAIETTSTETISSIINNSLGRTVQMEAVMADDLFKDVKDKVMMLGEYGTMLYRDQSEYAAEKAYAPNPAMEGIASAQLLYSESVDVEDPAIQKEVGLIANLSVLLTIAFRSTEQVNSCFISTVSGITLIADDRPSSKILEDGSVIRPDATERPWFIGAMETGKLFFTEPDRDYFTGEAGIVCAIPIYLNGQIVAVVGADLFLTSIESSIVASEGNGAFVCLVDKFGRVIFSPVEEGPFQVVSDEASPDLRASVNEDLAAFIVDALDGDGPTDVQVLDLDGRQYYAAGAPMRTVGWAVITVVDKEITDQPTVIMKENYQAISREADLTFNRNIELAKKTIMSLLLVIFILSITSALILGKRIVRPLGLITERIAGLRGENLQFKMEDSFRTHDEVEVLAESFADLSRKTVLYMNEIREVTAEKERIGAELSMAKSIQEGQLPRIFPPYPDRQEFELFASMTPAKEVGGDFYDFFLIDDDHIGLVMADVSGKGVPAALFMMISKILIKTHVQNGESPGTALANVNNQLLESDEAGMFVTVWLAVLTISTGEGIAANAGHEHPTIRRANGRYELVQYRHSPAVSTFEGIPFREHGFALQPGDSLFVYTDGVPEATDANHQLFGTERMLEALNRDPDADPEQVIRNVTDGIHTFVAGAEQFDDITMLCLRYNGPKKA